MMSRYEGLCFSHKDQSKKQHQDAAKNVEALLPHDDLWYHMVWCVIVRGQSRLISSCLLAMPCLFS